ncbi:hypothetical protein AVEN_27826-1 [Araneus ventricosus]|uniref:Uncharacterized protein n=1 Tax=Araneus ventricosus TaxID=182803 RepID=A0A4Y2GSI4_ARAVE|nr:hypothetical protein AVEN_27826-1 [Araneus ventricosus]
MIFFSDSHSPWFLPSGGFLLGGGFLLDGGFPVDGGFPSTSTASRRCPRPALAGIRLWRSVSDAQDTFSKQNACAVLTARCSERCFTSVYGMACFRVADRFVFYRLSFSFKNQHRIRCAV